MYVSAHSETPAYVFQSWWRIWKLLVCVRGLEGFLFEVIWMFFSRDAAKPAQFVLFLVGQCVTACPFCTWIEFSQKIRFFFYCFFFSSSSSSEIATILLAVASCWIMCFVLKEAFCMDIIFRWTVARGTASRTIVWAALETSHVSLATNGLGCLVCVCTIRPQPRSRVLLMGEFFFSTLQFRKTDAKRRLYYFLAFCYCL